MDVIERHPYLSGMKTDDCKNYLIDIARNASSELTSDEIVKVSKQKLTDKELDELEEEM